MGRYLTVLSVRKMVAGAVGEYSILFCLLRRYTSLAAIKVHPSALQALRTLYCDIVCSTREYSTVFATAARIPYSTARYSMLYCSLLDYGGGAQKDQNRNINVSHREQRRKQQMSTWKDSTVSRHTVL